MCTDIEMLEELKKLTIELLKSAKRFEKLSEKRAKMTPFTHSKKAIEKANADLNWHAMAHDKLLRSVHAVSVDCEVSEPRNDYSEIEYNIDSFHVYKFQPRVPVCKQLHNNQKRAMIGKALIACEESAGL